jgi:hypothetical protein
MPELLEGPAVLLGRRIVICWATPIAAADLEGHTETMHGRNLGAPYGAGRFRENHVLMGIEVMG